MKVLLQRVTKASVKVDDHIVGSINHGVLLLVGFSAVDTLAGLAPMAAKIVNLRIFNDAAGKMNLSLLDVPDSAILAVSQFTLLADCRKGRRPSYQNAAPAEIAAGLFDAFARELRKVATKVETGTFQAHMEVELVNDGPVTIWLDSEVMRRVVCDYSKSSIG